MPSSDSSDGSGSGGEGGRQQYANKCELMLSLVGYAVGLGNIWRFPSLAYTQGGGAFLIPYFCALIFLGLPLFILELGLGQIYRQGTLGVWEKMNLPALRGVGVAATICTFLVSLYYNVILAWTGYYLWQTMIALPSGILPWSDQVEGFTCPPTLLFAQNEIAQKTDLFFEDSGLFNPTYREQFWCPEAGIPKLSAVNLTEVLQAHTQYDKVASNCPARAALHFWETKALQQSSGMDDLGGFNYGLLASFTVMWIMIYFIIFKGVGSSGKVVYVTAILPYVALVAFFFRAITLPNAFTGLKFFLMPRMEFLLDPQSWLRAATQIFYSLGVGFGSLIAFASYGNKKDDFVGNAVKVSVINCSTSVFAGFVVFPILGYLAQEMEDINPCFGGEDLSDMKSIGLSGTGLAFVAFPIAISKMPLPFFWSLLFFLMLLSLGIDSQFAMVESVMTVLHDLGLGLSKPVLSAIVCGVSYLLGLIFVTKGGIYWFNLFDYYTCVVALFFVTAMECYGLMWSDPKIFPRFNELVEKNTGAEINKLVQICWKFICPAIITLLLALTFMEVDKMSAETEEPYPKGTGYIPKWSILAGWKLGLLPILGFIVMILCSGHSCQSKKTGEEGSSDSDPEEERILKNERR